MKTLTLKEKIELIESHESGTSKDDLMEKYQCGRTTVYTTLKNSEILKKQWLSGRYLTAKRIKARGKYDVINKQVYEWYCNEIKEGRVTGNMIRQKALELAQDMRMDLRASSGWLSKFKKRYQINSNEERLEIECRPFISTVSSKPLTETLKDDQSTMEQDINDTQLKEEDETEILNIISEQNNEDFEKMQNISMNPEKYCRICLEELKDQKFNITELSHLYTWLNKWSSLGVRSNDPLPKEICEKCFIKIEDFYEFSKMCISSAKMYQKIFNLNKQNNLDIDMKPIFEGEAIAEINVDSDSKNFEKETTDPLGKIKEEHIVNNDSDDFEDVLPNFSNNDEKSGNEYYCKVCDKRFCNKNEYEICTKKHLDSKEWSCSFCDKSYRKKSSLQSHIKILHENNPEIFLCPIESCGKSYKTKESIQKHCKRIHKIEYKPTNESKIEDEKTGDGQKKDKEKDDREDEHSTDSDSDDSFEKHFRKDDVNKKHRANTSKEVFTCEICQRNYFIEERREACMKKHQGIDPWVCKICGKAYRKQLSLRDHMNYQHAENPILYPCSFEGCDKVYKSKEIMRNHYKVVHLHRNKPATDERKFMCQECGKCFRLKSSLVQHIYIHTGEFPFKCDRCPKRFGTRYQLKIHCRRHDGIKNFVCTICGLRKITRKELVVHMKYHSRDVVHKCKYCSYTSCNHGQVTTHEKVVHLGIRSYKCKYCDESFGKAYTLKHHEMRHTGEKPYKCEVCGKGFIQITAMKTHMKGHFKGIVNSLTDKLETKAE